MDESPRWLLMNGRDEEAKASLNSLRHGKFTQEQIDAEFEEQKVMLKRDLEVEQGGVLEVFRGSKSYSSCVAIDGLLLTKSKSQPEAYIDRYWSQCVPSVNGSKLFIRLWHNLHQVNRDRGTIHHDNGQYCSQHYNGFDNSMPNGYHWSCALNGCGCCSSDCCAVYDG